MYEPLRRATLSLLKTPPEPRPPQGDPASLRVFHAGKNYLRLRLAGWAIAQLFALAGLIFWTSFLIDVNRNTREKAQSRAAAKESPPNAATNDATNPFPNRSAPVKTRPIRGWAAFKAVAVDFATKLPSGAIALVWTLKILGIVIYIAQLPITYALRRLDYEMRWYMVTDRSLRLRHGVWKITESTMSFANIQQVVVSQGPVQRLLGLADVKVKSAGGGDTTQQPGQPEGADMHTGLFHSVTNATEIRDLILERLRRFREAGLGDPDDKTQSIASRPTTPADTLAAARELSTEARALRHLLARRQLP